MAPNKKGHPCPETTFAVMLLPSLRLIPCSPSRPRHYGLITSLLFPDLPPPTPPPGQAQDMVILCNLRPKVKARDRSPCPSNVTGPPVSPPRAAIQTLIPSALSPSFGPGNAPQGDKDDEENDGLCHGNPSSGAMPSAAGHLLDNLSILYAKIVLSNGFGKLAGSTRFSR